MEETSLTEIVAGDWKKNHETLDLPPSLQAKDKHAARQRSWKPVKSYDEDSFGQGVFGHGDNIVKNAERNAKTANHWEIKALLEKGRNMTEDDVKALLEKKDKQSDFYDIQFDKYFKPVKKDDLIGLDVLVQFTPFQLAIIFQANLFLETVFEEMKTNEDLRKKLLETTVKVNEAIHRKRNPEEKSEENSYFDTVSTKLSSENIKDFNNVDDEICNLTPMHLAVKYNSEALETLIDLANNNEKDLITKRDSMGRSPLLLSVFNQSTKCTELLLNYYEVNLLRNKKMELLNRKEFEPTLLHEARSLEVVEFLLDRCGDTWGTILDEKRNTVLEHFIKYDSELANGYLNQHVSTNGFSRKSDKFLIHLDLNPMLKIERKERNEISVLDTINESEKRAELIQHPVVKTYTLLKFSSLRHFFILSFLLKLFYAFFITFLTLRVAHTEREVNKKNTTNLTTSEANLSFFDCNLIESNLFKGDPIGGYPCFFPWCIFVLLATLFKIVQEIWEITARSDYFKSFFNYVHWLLIISNITFISFLFTTTIKEVPDNWFFYYPAAVSLFISCNTVINAFGMMSRVGIYIFMMRQVCKKVIVFFSVYFVTIVAFAMVFYLTMGTGSPFESWTRAIVKVIAMMIGEVEYQDTFETWEKTEDYFLSILFVFFVFVVPIVINNLVIGLTVSNIEKLLKEAESRTLRKKIKQILEMEKVTLKNSIIATVFHSHLKDQNHHLCETFLKKTHDVCIKAKIFEEDLGDISDDKQANIFALLNDVSNNRRIPDDEHILKIVTPGFLRSKIPSCLKSKFKVPNSIVKRSLEILRLGTDGE